MQEKDKPRVVEVSNDLPIDQSISTAPVFYIDGAAGFAIANGAVKFNFFQDRLAIDPRGGEDQLPVTRVICARMVMSVESAMQLNHWLTDAISGYKKSAPQNGPEDGQK